MSSTFSTHTKNHVWTCLTSFHIIPSKTKNQKITCSISFIQNAWILNHPFFPHSPSIFHGKFTMFYGKTSIFHGEASIFSWWNHLKPSHCRPAPWPCGNRAPTAGRTRRWRAERRCLSHILPWRHQRCGPEHGYTYQYMVNIWLIYG